MGPYQKFIQCRRQLLVEVRRGAATCDDPFILGRDLDSAFTQSCLFVCLFVFLFVFCSRLLQNPKILTSPPALGSRLNPRENTPRGMRNIFPETNA